MPRYNVRHAECEGVGEGAFVEAEGALAALAKVNPIFKYPEGDCNSWVSLDEEERTFREAESRPGDTDPCCVAFVALAEGSPDYYLVYRVRMCQHEFSYHPRPRNGPPFRVCKYCGHTTAL
jgi:hypothetical protein